MIVRRCLFVAVILCLALASCRAGVGQSGAGAGGPAGPYGESGATEPTAKAGSISLAATATAGSRGAAMPAASPSGGPVILTWWVPDFMKPGGGQAGGPMLAGYLSEFEAVQPGHVTIVPVAKARYGRGGLLDLMRAARPVAPGVLPDLVALDLADLPAAAAAGLLQPLDGLISPALLDGLYPFARQAGQFGGRTLAIPIVTDVEHVIYNQEQIKLLPVTWAELQAGDAVYVFPAGSPPAPAAGSASEAVQRAFVSHYLSAGGTVNAETRRLALEETPLLRVLTFYGEGSAVGRIPPQTAEIISLEECWSAYVEGLASIADVSARRYLAGGAELTATGFGSIPGYDRPATPVASGWALAIITPDPDRQRAAAGWIAWLMAPERLGPWTQAAGWLPSRPAAWGAWGSQPYYDFLQAQLAGAVPVPAGLPDSQAALQLQKAVLTLLRRAGGDAGVPAEAARGVLTPQPPK